MASPRELEYRTLNLVEDAMAGRPLAERDVQAAAYRSWPGPPRAAAARLAAHANAARGKDLLWIIGLDITRPGKAKTPGADLARLNDWLAALSAFFDGVAPRVSGLRVPLAGNEQGKPQAAVVALHIETGRAPFVIRGKAGAKNGKAPLMEVPWLDADSHRLRTAGRLELVKLLSPLQDLPQFEILEAELTFYRNPHVSIASRATFRWSVDAAVYVMPRAEARVVIPLHRCRGEIAIKESSFRSDGTDFSLTADKNSPAVRVTESAAMIEGLGRFFIYCCGSTTDPQPLWQNPASLLIDLTPAGAERAATASAELRPQTTLESNQVGRWKL
jgi:hypothetical protein